jgi:hypothetical protein
VGVAGCCFEQATTESARARARDGTMDFMNAPADIDIDVDAIEALLFRS